MDFSENQNLSSENHVPEGGLPPVREGGSSHGKAIAGIVVVLLLLVGGVWYWQSGGSLSPGTSSDPSTSSLPGSGVGLEQAVASDAEVISVIIEDLESAEIPNFDAELQEIEALINSL